MGDGEAEYWMWISEKSMCEVKTQTGRHGHRHSLWWLRRTEYLYRPVPSTRYIVQDCASVHFGK